MLDLNILMKSCADTLYIIAVLSNPHYFTFWNFSGETKKCIIFLFVDFFVIIFRILSKKLPMNNKIWYFWGQQSDSCQIGSTLGTHRILFEHKKELSKCANHIANIFRMNCQKLEVEFLVSQNITYQWYTKFWLLNNAY